MTQHVLARGITAAVAAAATASLLPTAFAPAHASPAPQGQLVSARAGLHTWRCGPIADEKFTCSLTATPDSAGFTVVLRSTRDLPKWQEDPELQREIAYVARHWFLTVQPNPGLSESDLATVEQAVARGRR
ncbi:MAG TPA: hypothetical protein VGK78_10270 [Nocardioides sp.]|uniref:hypothetical protein n=1 Tax=Nocardioides sp. TaxID=35761 RepID=UPI002F41AB58